MLAIAAITIREIHTPPEPSWWPPAPGWWLLVIAAGIGIFWLSRCLWRWYQRRAPYRLAGKLEHQIFRRYTMGELTANEYANAVNGLLKRLIVHVEHQVDAAAEVGEDWNRRINRLAGTKGLSSETMAALTTDRFRSDGAIDTVQLHYQIQKLLRKPAS